MIELPPIKESSEDFEAVERRIKELFRKEIYYPILAKLGEPRTTIKNSSYDLLDAIQSGRIEFSRGTFTGKLNATLSKELKNIGAKWDRKLGVFKLPEKELPLDVRNAISVSDVKLAEKFSAIDKLLSKILPEEIADKLNVAKLFDATLSKTDRDFKASVKGITVAPALTPERRKKIADEWQSNMKKWISDFTEKEIKNLRTDIQATVFKGNRTESVQTMIQKSYGVTERKAKFLARQETALLMTKFKETRYTESGVDEYKWGCVAGSKLHPVRPWHKSLEGKIFKWSEPPVTSKSGTPISRNNPGEDFNCRCFAKPLVRFKKG